MKLATINNNGDLIAVVVCGDGGLARLSKLGFETIQELIEAGGEEWARVEAGAPDLRKEFETDEVVFAPPIPRTVRNIFAVGLNYYEHWQEGNRPDSEGAPDAPLFFTKPWTSLAGHQSTVVVDEAVTKMADWEGEIAVIVGRGGANIEDANGYDHIFGYALANDLSARDLQFNYKENAQWFKGKSLDQFCPMGPFITTSSDISDPTEIRAQLMVNGEVKQNLVAAAMIHDVPAILTQLSLGMSLLPGDIILTGTPSGVGLWQDPQQFLVQGDRVEMTSNFLGELVFEIG